MQSTRNPKLDILAGIQGRFEKHGWTVMAVLPGDDGSPSFTYSIGFEQTFGMPEVIFVGFNPELAQSLIAGIARSLEQGEFEIPTQEQRIGKIVRNFDVLARPVSKELTEQTAIWATAFNKPLQTRLVQMFIPDPQGLFPDDAGCDPQYVSMQDMKKIAEGD